MILWWTQSQTQSPEILPIRFSIDYSIANISLYKLNWPKLNFGYYVLDAVGSSGILKGKQKLGVTFNSDKLGGINFTKFSKLSMCSAGTGRCWLVLVKVYV